MPLTVELEPIQKMIQERKIDIIFVDSLGAACGSELNKPEPAINFFMGLRKLNVTSLLLAQTSKSEDGKKSIFGSTYFTYYARSIFELCKSEELGIADDANSSVALFHRWSNYTKKYPAMGFSITDDNNNLFIEKQSVDITEFIGKASMANILLKELREGALSLDKLKERTGINQSNIRATLSKLKVKGLVQQIERGVWGLTMRGVTNSSEKSEAS